MQIESLKLINFKAFQTVELRNLPRMCVFVGANGSGKSTLFDVFGFLKDAFITNIRQAVQLRGGFREMISRGHEDEDITIEIQFRMSVAGLERLVTYHLRIGCDKRRPFIRREILRYKRAAHGSPYHFLDFRNGSGYAVTNEEDFNKPDEELDREQHQLSSADILAVRGLGQFQRFRAASAFRHLIENWHISEFHISAARGAKDAAGYDEHLTATGDNLQLVAQYLFENYPETYDNIIEQMKKRVPGIAAIEPYPTPDGRLLLRFRDGSFKEPFIDRHISDGTIKMFAYLVLLYDPSPHPLLSVEEPENQLYPKLLWELAEEFRLYALRGGQVFVSTHSPDFLNAVRPEEGFLLSKDSGFTTIRRAADDRQIAAFVAEGDLMGYLWKEGLFTGVDPQ